MRQVVFWALFFCLPTLVARAQDLSIHRCSTLERQTLKVDMDFLNRRLDFLLRTDKGLPSFDLDKVSEVYISRLSSPEENPHTDLSDGYYKMILGRLVSGVRSIRNFMIQNSVALRCESAQEADCRSTALAYVEQDSQYGAALDNVIHVCPRYFATKNSPDRIGTLGHELSHRVLNTDHRGLKIFDPHSYPNVASDAYTYGDLIGTMDLQDTLRLDVWRVFWFNDLR